MKRIPYVPDLPVFDITRRPVVAPDGKPVFWQQARFLRERIADPRFVGRREGFEAVAYMMAAEQELAVQEPDVPARGYWEVEDDRGKSFEAAVKTPTHPTYGYRAEVVVSLMPNIQAVVDMSNAPGAPVVAKPLPKRSTRRATS